MAIQKPRSTCQAVWLPTKRMLAEIISEKRRKVPNCAEKCRKVPKSAEYWAQFGNMVPNCAEKIAEYFAELCPIFAQNSEI